MVTLRQILEAILFASAKPLPISTLREILKSAAQASPDDEYAKAFATLKDDAIEVALTELQSHLTEPAQGFDLIENAGGWQLVSHPHCGLWVRQLFPELKPARLSAPALETLAIIAYRQPLTRADIEAVRGVAVDGVMQTLLDRGLVKIAGRADVPGRPLLYETTQFFMEHFGLKTLDELPNSEELRRVPLPQAPTAEPKESSHPREESSEEATSQTNTKLPEDSSITSNTPDHPSDATTEEERTLPESIESKIFQDAPSVEIAETDESNPYS